MLEHAVRDVLNRTAPRRFAVLDPLKVVIENYPEGQVEQMEVVNNPEDPSAGTRTRAVRARAVDRARRLHGGAAAEVLPAGARARGAAAVGLLRDLPRGREGRRRARSSSCAAPTTRRRAAATRPTADGPRRRSTGSRPRTPCPPRCGCTTTCSAGPDPGAGRATCSPTSTRDPRRCSGALVEPGLADAPVGETVQFERLGYFTPDPDSAPSRLVFNRTLTLKDTWAKVQGAAKASPPG